MDRQAYLRRLHARMEHVEGALSRALELNPEHAVQRKLDALRDETKKIEAATDDWEHHRETVEKQWEELHSEVGALEGTFDQVAESLRDGAVELFRGEPSKIIQQAEEIIRKANANRG